jgi:Tfp pilus assembly protein PilX
MLSRRKSRGQVLLLSVVLLSVVLGLVGAFTSYLNGVRKATNTFSARAAARQAAQAGIEKALWCLNQTSGTDCGGLYGAGYTGQSSVSIGGSSYYTTSLATLSTTFKTITSTGYYPNVTKPTAIVKLKADVSITTVEASFHYGVQSGEGGFEMGNNAYVAGNIYANGNIIGSNGAYVTGDAWVAGGTALTPDQQQTTNNADYTFGQVSPTLDIAQSFKLSDDGVLNKVSLYLRKVGSPGDVTVRILANNNGVPSKTVIASTTLNAASVTTSFAWVDASFSSPPGLAKNVTYWLSIDASSSGTKYWVIGSQPNNGYGNGVGMVSADWSAGTPVWSDAGRDYAFQAYLGGVTTKIDNVDINGTAHANTIKDDTVGGNAYYKTLTNATVTGTQYPNSADPGPQDFPFSEANIAQWKSEATAGGTITGDVTYDGTSNTLGPKVITGNLTIKNGAGLTMTGTLYVKGDLLLDNLANVGLSSGYGGGSGGFVVDGKITVSNNVTFFGSGTPGSYVVLLTTNTSLDPNSPAMTLNNNSTNSIFYASAGMISIAPGATIKEVTAFKLYIQNNGAVQYESGLANINFSSGPGGSWALQTGSIREIR